MAGLAWHVWKPFRNEFSGNLAVFCSDERYAAATLEFLRVSLNLDRCDLFVAPGGPAFIAEDQAPLMERLHLLASAHKLRRIVLIAHADCGYYHHRASATDREAIEAEQQEELRLALERVPQLYPEVTVEGYQASVDQWGFIFMPTARPALQNR